MVKDIKVVDQATAQKIVASSIGVGTEIYITSQQGGGSGSTGVSSFNGETGDVVATGSNLDTSSTNTTSISDSLELKADKTELNNYTKTEDLQPLLDAKADVTVTDDLQTAVTVNSGDITELQGNITELESAIDDNSASIDTINTKITAIQSPSVLTLTLSGVDSPFPTDYTSVTFQEAPLNNGDLMTTDLKTVTFNRSGFVDLQITGELKANGIMEMQLLMNGTVAPLSHYIKSLTTIYNTYSFTYCRIGVNTGDTLELQVKSTTGTANSGIMFIREVY